MAETDKVRNSDPEGTWSSPARHQDAVKLLPRTLPRQAGGNSLFIPESCSLLPREPYYRLLHNCPLTFQNSSAELFVLPLVQLRTIPLGKEKEKCVCARVLGWEHSG